jgi:hypothetical protein
VTSASGDLPGALDPLVIVVLVMGVVIVALASLLIRTRAGRSRRPSAEP